MQINKFIFYRIESVLMLLIFIGSFVSIIYTKDLSWILLAWAMAIILKVHLHRIKCPKCGAKVMLRFAPKNFQNKWFMLFPKKCDSCKNEL